MIAMPSSVLTATCSSFGGLDVDIAATRNLGKKAPWINLWGMVLEIDPLFKICFTIMLPPRSPKLWQVQPFWWRRRLQTYGPRYILIGCRKKAAGMTVPRAAYLVHRLVKYNKPRLPNLINLHITFMGNELSGTRQTIPTTKMLMTYVRYGSVSFTIMNKQNLPIVIFQPIHYLHDLFEPSLLKCWIWYVDCDWPYYIRFLDQARCCFPQFVCLSLHSFPPYPQSFSTSIAGNPSWVPPHFLLMESKNYTMATRQAAL